MATITQLPAELLQQLLQNFEDDKATLCHMSLVSPLFATVAQELLLRHLELSVDPDPDGLETSFDQLVKLLDEKPQLSTHVQSLTISSEHAWNQALKAMTRLFNLLSRVTSLRSLDLNHELVLSEDGLPLFHSCLDTNPLARLSKLRLRNPFIRWSIFTELLQIPNLDTLVLDHLPVPPLTFPNPLNRVCSLRILEVGYWRGQPNSPQAIVRDDHQT